MLTDALRKQAAALLESCRKKNLRIATAESCTGGLLAALLTDIPGSSDVFERGFITYSYAAKTEMLGVHSQMLSEHGAVSEQVAAAMAEGALKRSQADLSVGITGLAGPGGGTEEKPVGLVYIATAARDSIIVENERFKGDRDAVRLQSVGKALDMLADRVSRSFVYVA